MTRAIVVVPCYNEARRLNLEEFCAFLLAHDEIDLLFVDDGSTDATAELLTEFCSDMAGRCWLLKLFRNLGKAAAVREGLLAASARGCELVGFWDADLATPLDEIPNFCQLLAARPEAQWAFGSRVRLLGRAIERRPLRHYLGRIWATSVSLLLRLPVYDTQCGAKLFRNTDELRAVLAEPFVTRWVFDVELIARLLRLRPATVQQAIHEIPLAEWRDVAGSKLRARDFVRASVELARIYFKYLRDMDVDQHQPPASPPSSPAPGESPSISRETAGSGIAREVAFVAE